MGIQKRQAKNRLYLRAHDSKIFILNKRGRKELGERKQVMLRVGNNTPKVYSVAMSLAHLLYPKHFPKLLAISADAKATYSERVVLTKKSEGGIKARYAKLHEIYGEHNKDIRKDSDPKAKEIMNESGIIVEETAFNIGRRKKAAGKGEPVFFEVRSINTNTLRTKINSMRSSLKKQQAEGLFNALLKHGKLHGSIIMTHVEAQ